MNTPGPVTRALLTIRDQRLRRCTWCGAYHQQPCHSCQTPAVTA